MHQLLSMRFKIWLVVVIAATMSGAASRLGYDSLSLAAIVGFVDFSILQLMLHSWGICTWLPLAPRPKWAKVNLYGQWSGHIQSSWKNPSNETSPVLIPVSIDLHQNWREVVFCMTTEKMKSRSSSAIVDFDVVTHELRFRYFYKTETNVASSLENPPQLYGSAVAIVNLNKPDIMNIHYTNERGHGGDIELTKIAFATPTAEPTPRPAATPIAQLHPASQADNHISSGLS